MVAHAGAGEQWPNMDEFGPSLVGRRCWLRLVRAGPNSIELGPNLVDSLPTLVKCGPEQPEVGPDLVVSRQIRVVQISSVSVPDFDASARIWAANSGLLQRISPKSVKHMGLNMVSDAVPWLKPRFAALGR